MTLAARIRVKPIYINPCLPLTTANAPKIIAVKCISGSKGIKYYDFLVSFNSAHFIIFKIAQPFAMHSQNDGELAKVLGNLTYCTWFLT
jgi:hypothetical protein